MKLNYRTKIELTHHERLETIRGDFYESNELMRITRSLSFDSEPSKSAGKQHKRKLMKRVVIIFRIVFKISMRIVTYILKNFP